jgi:penicillin-binding protein 1A
VLFERRPQPAQVLVAAAHVTAMNDMLGAVLVSGTGKRAALPDHPAAGKTGTSQDFRDAWFVGYTTDFVGGVWVGNDDGRPMNKVMGGNLPARLWHDVMQIAHEGRATTPLPGLAPASIAALVAGTAQPAAAPASAPLLPRERIGAEFFERAASADLEPTAQPPARAQPSGSGFMGTAKALLRGLGFGT